MSHHGTLESLSQGIVGLSEITYVNMSSKHSINVHCFSKIE